jgi:hypothetical protein
VKHQRACSLIVGILLSLPAAASETGTVVAYNVKQQNMLQVPPCPTALGDGSTNDTAAIQCALTAAGNAGGGIVFLPQGTYRTSASLAVPSSVILEGAGAGTRITPLNGATIGQGIVMLSNSTTPVSFATIRNLHIDGNGANIGGVVAGVALDYGANHNTISDLVVENARAEGIGLYISNVSLMNDYNVISGNTIHDNGVGPGGCGQLIVWGGRSNHIVGNTIYKGGTLRSPGGWGILFNVNNTALSVQHNIVHGNTISNTGYAGILLSQGQCTGCTTQIAWNEISGNITKPKFDHRADASICRRFEIVSRRTSEYWEQGQAVGGLEAGAGWGR